VRTCNTCYGSGKIPKEKCGVCRGAGIVRKEEEITIVIPPGINNGEMIRLSGAGEAVTGGVPGDLYVKIHVQKHPVFKKEGSNLTMDLNIKLSDALLGGVYTVDTLDGTLSVKIPEGVTFGEILRVRGKGVPLERGRRGDLLIKLHIQLPSRLSRKAKKIIEELKKEGV
jgi:molecular chaperone DnaJ